MKKLIPMLACAFLLSTLFALGQVSITVDPGRVAITSTQPIAISLNGTTLPTTLPTTPATINPLPGIDPGAVLMPGTTQRSDVQLFFNQSQRKNGFPIFSVPGPVICIAADGLDSNAGTPDAPIATHGQALKILNGGGGSVLYKYGDAFVTDTIFPNDFEYLGAYGDPSMPRPVISNPNSDIISIGGKYSRTHIIIQSLDLHGTPGNGHNAIRAVCVGDHFWVDDCRVLNAGDVGILFQGFGGSISDLIISHCQTYGSSNPPKCQGFYADGITEGSWIIDRNTLDHNGWTLPSDISIFSHNVYIQLTNGRGWFTNNFSGHPASHGAQVRCGGVVDGNYIFDTAIGLYIADNSSAVQRNVIEGAHDIQGVGHGTGIELGGCDNITGGNLFLHKMDPLNNQPAVVIDPMVDTDGIKPIGRPKMKNLLQNNIAYLWTGAGVVINDKDGNGNVIWPLNTPPREVNNDWTGSRKYVDPTRNLDTYAKSIGLSGQEELILDMSDNRLGNFNPALTPEAINQWVRAGFQAAGR